MRRRSPDLTPIVPSDITPESKFRSRRAIIAGGLGAVFVQTFGLVAVDIYENKRRPEMFWR